MSRKRQVLFSLVLIYWQKTVSNFFSCPTVDYFLQKSLPSILSPPKFPLGAGFDLRCQRDFTD